MWLSTHYLTPTTLCDHPYRNKGHSLVSWAIVTQSRQSWIDYHRWRIWRLHWTNFTCIEPVLSCKHFRDSDREEYTLRRLRPRQWHRVQRWLARRCNAHKNSLLLLSGNLCQELSSHTYRVRVGFQYTKRTSKRSHKIDKRLHCNTSASTMTMTLWDQNYRIITTFNY